MYSKASTAPGGLIMQEQPRGNVIRAGGVIDRHPDLLVLSAFTVNLATAYPEDLVGHEVFPVFRLAGRRSWVCLPQGHEPP